MVCQPCKWAYILELYIICVLTYVWMCPAADEDEDSREMMNDIISGMVALC